MNARVQVDTSTSDTAVELCDVCKVYRQPLRSERARDVLRHLFAPKVREVHALRHVNLEVRRGEIVAYAGPNGAGKSTTVKLLSSLLGPTSGTVRALGMDPVRDRIRYVKHIGVVFGQRTELWWDHPVAASFDWKRVVWDIPRDRYEKNLEWLKGLLGLDDFFKSLVRELSLGQKMRADLGLMLLHDPEILFLDEPTIGLDVLAKKTIIDLVKSLNKERGVTVMVTSHDSSDLEQLAGRIVLIDKGAIAFDGDFDRLRREHGDRRRLLIETENGVAPVLADAECVATQPGRHEYVFDASRVRIADLLDQAAAQCTVLDVETHRVPIDDVIADIYRGWQGAQDACSPR